MREAGETSRDVERPIAAGISTDVRPNVNQLNEAGRAAEMRQKEASEAAATLGVESSSEEDEIRCDSPRLPLASPGTPDHLDVWEGIDAQKLRQETDEAYQRLADQANRGCEKTPSGSFGSDEATTPPTSGTTESSSEAKTPTSGGSPADGPQAVLLVNREALAHLTAGRAPGQEEIFSQQPGWRTLQGLKFHYASCSHKSTTASRGEVVPVSLCGKCNEIAELAKRLHEDADHSP